MTALVEDYTWSHDPTWRIPVYDRAAADRRARYRVATATGRHDLTDATLYVGPALRIAMRVDYPNALAWLADTTGLPPGRIAIVPILDAGPHGHRTGPHGWRLRGPHIDLAS